MKYRTLGASGLKIGAVSLGSWLTIGGSVDAKGSERIVRAAFDRGVNLFDTADVYRRGEAEKALGAALKGLPRHRLVLASKCYFPMSEDVNDRGLSRKHVHESVDASLRRLSVDYLDLYQCHRFDDETPLIETARAMDDLIRRGKILYWGTSQWPAERIAEVVLLCRAEHLHPPISNQPLYNLFERGIEEAVLPTCARMGISQIVYSPLAQGVLTGKYGLDGRAPKDARGADVSSNQFLGRYLTPDRLARAREFADLARAAGARPEVLALAFCLRDPRVASVIVGARTPEQLESNLAAAEYEMPPDLLSQIEEIFPA
ncbi:MAG: aldo/keto reductase family protein [Planctomycetota bacterium]